MSESRDPGLEVTVPGTDPPATGAAATKTDGGGGERLGRYQIVGRVEGGGRELLRARDPQLDRRLVIRVERPGEQTAEAKAELLAQARAMAQLRHPAVMPIFDVGTTEDGVYRVMPEVGGGTLEAWLRGERGWKDVAQRFVAAGRGLAAAHAAGLVHPGFAASEVHVGAEGEVLVADLVRGDDGAKREDVKRFAESLRAAVRDRRPPAWLAGVLDREPSSMTKLLDGIERRMRRPRRIAMAAAGVAVVAGVVAVMMLARGDEGVACPDPAPRLASVWDEGVKTKIAAAFAQAKVPYAQDMLARLVPTIDRHAASWRSATIETCRTHAGGRRDTAMYDKRMRCYGRWLEELGGVAQLLGEVTDRKSVEGAAAAAREVDGAEACADVAALAKVPEPPPEKRAETDAVEREVFEIQKLRKGGTFEGLVERSAAVVERAREVDHPTPLTRALAEHYAILRLGRDTGAMRTTLEELARTAASGGHHPSAAHAWLELYRLVGSELGKPDEAKQLLPAVQAAVARAGEYNVLELRVLLLKHEAEVIDDHGESARALALLEQARTLMREAGADQPGGEHADLVLAVTAAIGAAHGAAGNLDRSIEAFQEVIRIGGELYGGEHPQVASMRANLGETYRRAQRFEEALAAYREVARIFEKSLGESSALVRARERTGAVLLHMDRLDEGVKELEAAIAIAERVLQPGDPARLGLLGTYAQGLRDLERYDEALRRFDEVIAALEAAKANPGTLLTAKHNRAGTLRELKRWDEAIAGYQDVIAAYDAAPGNEQRVLLTLAGLGMAFVDGGKPAGAIAPLERAIAIKPRPVDEAMQRTARFYLGRALVESRRDTARGIAEVRAARAAKEAAEDGAEELAVVDTWLAKHAPR